MVAVGTRISPRPPHRSQRALLTHWAPPSGFGVEAVTGQGVTYADRRKVSVGQAGKAFPVEERLLASPLERLQPAPSDFFEEPPKARIVALVHPVVQIFQLFVEVFCLPGHG